LPFPTSLIATFGLMWAMGFTLNVITLLALTLAVGIVIDDAIVVLENIYRFMEEKNLPPIQAAIEGHAEIGFAVMATDAVADRGLFAVAFMKGIVGRFLAVFGLTMSFAILVSLLVAFTLTPMLTARWRPRKKTGEREVKSGHDGASRNRGFYATSTALIPAC
jgi:HAE1 family hydrophobic/amphiphilic exporter-1